MLAHDLPTIPNGTASAADVGPVSTWFEAPTPSTALRLRVGGAAGPARHAADAAITLQGCATLLDALDDWIGFDLAWRWTEAPAPSLAERSHVRADWHPAGSEVGTQATSSAAMLELPWALLRGLSPPTDTLAQQLLWPDVPAAIVISRLRVDAQALRAIEPGGAVVLHESMHPDWQGVLRAADEPADVDAGVALDLSSPLAPRLIEPKLRYAAAVGRIVDLPDPDQPIVCEVRLGTARVFGVERLAGWCGGELGELGPQASLWRRAGVHEPSRCLASGRLMPWGNGWALALEAVGEGGTQSAAKL